MPPSLGESRGDVIEGLAGGLCSQGSLSNLQVFFWRLSLLMTSALSFVAGDGSEKAALSLGAASLLASGPRGVSAQHPRKVISALRASSSGHREGSSPACSH